MADSPRHPTGVSASPRPWADAAARLSALWRQGQVPDLKEFLAGAGLLGAAELTDLLCTDQRQRWLHGQRPEAEAYIALHGSFHPGSESAIDLVFGEFLARRELGEAPTLDEYCRRFPNLADQLRLHVELDAMLPTHRESSVRENVVLPSIAGYEVESVLGQGGAGVVFRARHLRLSRPVAIKMLLAGAYAGPTELMRFQLEAEAVAGLCHPNVVQIYEIGEHEGRPFFAMEFVDGSLAQKLAAPSPPGTGCSQNMRWAAHLVATLADAVSAAHRAGIIHRDLKPGNILLTADGTPKISDFGLARRLKGKDGLTWTGTAVGTPSYMSPEQASDTAGPVGPATDVYGLGAVLYELLTGRPPFRGGTPLETFRQVLSQEPVPPSRLNPRVTRDLETVCLKCLRKDPKQRYTSAAALAEDLQRYLQGQVVTARPVGAFERTVKWVRRNQLVASLSAVAALALVAGTVVSLVFGIEASQKADELEKQAIELRAQTQRAEENEKQTARVLVSGLLSSIGRDRAKLFDPLNATEVSVMRQLRAISPGLRMQFLETALRDRDTALRIGRRADWVVQAIVGDDRALRADVAALVVRRIQEPSAPQEVRFACARLGLAVNVTDSVWAEHAAEALLAALRDPQTEQRDFPTLGAEISAVCERLSPARAAVHEGTALDFFFTHVKLPRSKVLFWEWTQGFVAVSSRLDAATATRAAETLTAQFCHADCDPYAWYYLSQALAAVSRRLPASQADDHIFRTIDFLVSKREAVKDDEQKSIYQHVAMSLTELCPPHPQPDSGDRAAPIKTMDPARASRVADAVVAMFGDKARGFEFTNYIYIKPLTQVAGFLDAADALRVAESMVLKTRNAREAGAGEREIKAALSVLCRRLDAAGSKRMAEAFVAAARDPKSKMPVHVALADPSVVLAGQLSPAEAASLEDALVDSLLADLAATKLVYGKGYVGKALATASGHRGATRTARVADALGAAIRDPQTPAQNLKSMTASILLVCAQLPPPDSFSRRERTLADLDSLWNARSSPQDRSLIIPAQAALWPHLQSTDAAGRARKAAAYLDETMRNPNLDSDAFTSLAVALPRVCNFLELAERRRHANSRAELLLDSIYVRKYRSVDLPPALAAVSVDLDQAGVSRLADTMFALLEEGKFGYISFELVPTTQLDPVFKKVAGRLDERDLLRHLNHPLTVGNPQRIFLDALPASRKHSFRNLWHYLDDPDAHGKGPDVLTPGTNRNR